MTGNGKSAPDAYKVTYRCSNRNDPRIVCANLVELNVSVKDGRGGVVIPTLHCVQCEDLPEMDRFLDPVERSLIIQPRVRSRVELKKGA